MSDKPKRRWFQFGIGATVLLAVLCTVWMAWNQFVTEPGYDFPDPASIASMTAKLDNGRKFLIPKDKYEDVLSGLRPSRLDRFPAKWGPLGSLEITTHDGQSVYVGLYRLGRGVGAFSAGESFESREYYRGGNTGQLEAALEGAATEAQAPMAMPQN